VSDEPQLGRDERILDSHVAQLAEHFDTVQIIATRYDDRTTRIWAWGAGNWYGRVGSIRAWLLREERDWADDRADEDDG
jgi:hypothetical protein